MSHELRTPLNAIVGFAEVLESNRENHLNETEVGYASAIRSGGAQLHGLIDDVLDLARVESGRLQFRKQAVFLAGIMEYAQGLLQPLARKSQIVLTIHPYDQNAELIVDEIRVRQVLTNLVSNAIKYNRPGGTVQVTCTLSERGLARFDVADDGLGIPPGHAEHVFEAFNRLGREYSTTEGSGIGLALCRRLVEGMDGTIGFESRTEGGTLFWFELPFVTGSEPVTIQSPAGQLRATKFVAPAAKTILYIEDRQANIDVVETILSYRPNTRLLSAPDAARGIEAAKSEDPDLILLDIHLPGINGLDAIALLRACPQVRAVPIIALTAAAMPDDIERGRAAGFDDYLTKPIEPASFLLCIDKALA
jgi:CheY-like chemotaxis protein